MDVRRLYLKFLSIGATTKGVISSTGKKALTLLFALTVSACAVITEYDEYGVPDRTILTPAIFVYTPKASTARVLGLGVTITPFGVSAGAYKLQVITPHHTKCSAVIIVNTYEEAEAWVNYLNNVNEVCTYETHDD